MMMANKEDKQPPTEPIDAEERTEVVSSVGRLLQEKYVFPDVAQQMVELLEKNKEKKKYESIQDPQEYAQHLTEDLRSVSNDKHLTVQFHPEGVQKMRAHEREEQEEDTEILAEQLKELQFDNFGFKEVRILSGNVGYIDLHMFAPANVAGETAVAAMNLVANCSALIFDLCKNGGGCPSMIQLLTSYLYDGQKPVYLNSFDWREKDEMEQFWTLPYVPGKRLPKDAPVYVLTSRRTFSAAEGFAYNLKHLKRATIVGETTGGGAHPGGTEVATDRFLVCLPKGRAINPITKTNWEGTGVEPDIKVDKEKALKTAHVDALERLIAKNRDPFYTTLYQRHLEILKTRK